MLDYLPEEKAYVETLKEYGLPEALAKDCLFSRNADERSIVIEFLERYGAYIKA
ncbi:hypothetical protein [Cytobacillus purgationiresistens]|uniref:Uncharacterized protein n=1 Tax=Cytobacillus purgationiresistens TaxID=863449 RepID=A0ABU0AK07_9BACI|nr:hypothetical protein [Cytobacillus purgationiresistens]MDQ0270738.1 hypothetical protein [Cytobacillus purgationiresistens]